MTAEFITAPVLRRPGVAHGFFTRRGGVSTGLYASLNGGSGSRDDRAGVFENRRRMCVALGVEPERLAMPFLVHSAEAVATDNPFPEGARPRCDGLATRTPGLALGVTGADCGVVLLACPEDGVVAACHAGWRGALLGVLEATVDRMEDLGTRRDRVVAAVGPTIAQGSYEVGPEFRESFLARDAGAVRFFQPSGKPDHHLFDLPAFIVARLTAAGVGTVEDLGLDTYADEERFFSYRRATHRGEADYGRLVAMIALR